ncbi:MAG: outer-membrane lipoprotein carrier protein LolA [Acidobacteriota bacterium]
MKRSIRTMFAAVLAITVISLFSTVKISAQPGIIGEVLRRMENHYKTLSTLKASVKMDLYTSQIEDHESREGSLIFIPQKGRDAAFRIDWTKPSSESLSVVNKQYVMYQANLKQATTGSVNGVRAPGGSSILSILNMSKVELKANFDINYVGLENVTGGTSTWHLQLIPKTAIGYKSADIWVDADGMPVQLKQVQKNNDSTTVLLYALNKNSKIDARDVQVSVPKGTKVIKS